MFLIKIGGSVITNKRELYTYRKDVVLRLAVELALSEKSFVLVHGAGSYGHIIADETNLGVVDFSKEMLMPMAQVQMDVRRLNLKFMQDLKDAGLPVVSMPPGAMLTCSDGKIKEFDASLFKRYSKMGFNPVTFGDVVLDDERGHVIISGDQIMEVLLDSMEFEKVAFIADVDGIFTSNPALDKDAELLEKVRPDQIDELCTNVHVSDVTGGMRNKLEAMACMAKKGVDVHLLNGTIAGRLEKFLKGEHIIGTVMEGQK